MKNIKSGVLIATIISLAGSLYGQGNPFQIYSPTVTEERATRLSWESESNTVYRIEYAAELVDTNTGLTAWQTLYDFYASHGTNTFWLDTGNYLLEPPILHPKNVPMRFYRVVNEGTNAGPAPTVTITSPTNSSTVFGDLTVIVSASTDQATISTKLYVDGEEMPAPNDSTNYVNNSTNYLIDTYVINTCEWPNASHTLFAVAECASGFPWPTDAAEVVFGRAVSAFVPVTFDNLITKYSFSEAFFNPDVGQTQQVSAVFTANVDWTLEIQNDSTNSVRTVTGSGTSMQFDWDGKGDGGTNLPAGVYTYLLSAETNGQSFSSYSGQGSGDSLSGASADLGDSTELLAMPADGSGSAVPLIIYPPGIDTNNLIIFEGSMLDYQADSILLSAAGSDIALDSGGAAAAAAGPSQSTRAPVRLPTNPVNKIVGNFGLAYQDYWPNGISLQAPPNGLGLGQRIQLENTSGSTTHNYRDLANNSENDRFIKTMKRGAWSSGFVKKNYDLRGSDLRKASLGGTNIFNTNGVSLGMLYLHGSFGTSQDFDQASGANGAMQIYFAIDGRPNASPSWVRMSEMDFGSAGTNGLKWMALMACNSLREDNWNSIQNIGGWTPFNSNLHLLLGTDSVADAGGTVFWAKFMLGLDNNPKETIMAAWYDSGKSQAQPGPLKFAVAGYVDVKQDMLTGTNSFTPQGSIFYETQIVKQ
ncbi:MAG: hypothetical protein HY298_02700 [Verrucomicrobia bacterium]|nr:hypothetical protein [Verrucomicrobiota bacterium]